MLILLRIVFGAALIFELFQGARSASALTGAGDTTPAFYLGVFVILAILNALVWAPYFGAKVSGPLTGMITEGAYVERANFVLRFIRWLEARRFRRTVALLCFWEGVRHPGLPAAFAIGLRNARPGSWLEKVYAREVFRFDNTQNCVQAYLALKRHGIDPRPHAKQEVNIILLSLERPPRPEADIVSLKPAPQAAPLRRNPRIQLFKQAGAGSETESQAPPGEPEVAEDRSQTLPSAPQSQERPETPGDQGTDSRNRGGWCAALVERVVEFIRAH